MTYAALPKRQSRTSAPWTARATRQCLILVGGKGTRLGGLAASTPKPLMALNADEVFLDRLIFEISRHGFTDIVLLAGHMAEQVRARYEDRQVRSATIRVVVEESPAGTAGALLKAASILDPTFLLCNGDTLFEINYRRLEAALARNPRAMAALALARVPDGSRYGTVGLSGERIVRFLEKSGGTEALINGGVALLRSNIVRKIAATPASIERDVYPRCAAEGQLIGEVFSGFFIDIGLPETLEEARRTLATKMRRPAVFFDRDGVLNRDGGYTYRSEDLAWLPGAKAAVRRVNEAGALAIVVTNQAGVARGFYDEDAVNLFHATMANDLALEGGHIDAFYTCPYHPEAAVERYRRADHADRKPNPGMIVRALAEWPIERSRSVLIGDQDSDLEAARRAGVHAILSTEDTLEHVIEEAISFIRPIGTG